MTARRIPGSRTIARIARACRRTLRPTTDGIERRVVEAKRRELGRRRAFGPADLEALEALARSAAEVLPVREAFAHAGKRSGVLTIRHDMDHDVENSIRFAEWEAARGIRSSYYVLHTDWYWGERPDEPSQFLVRALGRIARLGHEIGVHNNAITVGLRERRDPAGILDEVLGGLRRHGFDVIGTAAHGDPLCRLAGYLNSELFTECANAKDGPPDRTIRYVTPESGTSYEVTLRPVPMAELGLAYEANFIGQGLYVSDAGGRWNTRLARIQERFVSEEPFLQALVHPLWWAFQGEPIRPRPAIGEATA